MRFLPAAVIAATLVVAPAALGATSVAVVGDPGYGGAGEAAVAGMVTGWNPDAVILTGDNYYTAGIGSPGASPAAYDTSIGRYYCPFIRGAVAGPYCAGGTSPANRLWPVVGNHDYSDGGISNYLGYFALPGAERYYQQRIGDMDLFVLDSDEMLRTPAEMATQKAWLQAGLASSTAAFQVVAVHHPQYTSSARGPYAALRWPFADWGADLVLNGHDHFYERLTSGGLTYVVNGIGGASLSAWPSPGVPESTAHYSGTFGAMRMSVTPTALTAAFVTTDGVVRDAFTISRDGASVTPVPLGGATDGGAVAATPAAIGRSSATTVRWMSARRVRVDSRVALAGAAAGARVKVAITVSRSGRVLGRGSRVTTVGTAAPSALGMRVVLGRRVAGVVGVGDRVRVKSVVTTMPPDGAASTTTTTTRTVRVR